MFRFQKLDVYILAKEIVMYNYKLTKAFPDYEKYSLVQQMNRAAISIPSNIAEGTSRNSIKDRIHFINIAYASLMELTCQMEISYDLKYIDNKEYNEYVNKSKNLSVKLSNFMKSMKNEMRQHKEKT
jgi:four helix bundle protein